MKRLRRHPEGALIALALIAIAVTVEVASAVSLDTSFGGDGKASTPIGPDPGDEDTAFAVAIQPDGKIVVAGSTFSFEQVTTDFAIARFNPNGSLDPGFGGGDGIVTTDASVGLSEEIDEAEAITIQADGKILVAGYAGAPFPYSPGGDFAAVRLESDGSLDDNSDLDGGFGGDGIVVVDVSGSLEDAAYGAAIQDDGKIVLAGQAGAPWDFGLVRLDPDGNLDDNSDLDGGFGGDGVVQTNVGGFDQEDFARAVTIQPDDKIVAAGVADLGPDFTDTNFAAVRYLADGSLDPGFGAGGKTIVEVGADRVFPWDEANAVALQDDGKIVLAGSAVRKGTGYEDFALVRLTANGAPDPEFSGDGELTKTVSRVNESSTANAVAVQADGRIVAAGRTVSRRTEGNPLDFGFARFESDGSKDSSFGCDGAYAVDVAPSEDRDRLDVATGIALQPDGKIVAGGTSDMGPVNEPDLDFSVVRLNSGGPAQDCDPPQTTITKAPARRTHDRTPKFRFTSDEAGATFECKLDGKRWDGCSSPERLDTLSYGRHAFRVRASDETGNVDPSPAEHRFKILHG